MMMMIKLEMMCRAVSPLPPFPRCNINYAFINFIFVLVRGVIQRGVLDEFFQLRLQKICNIDWVDFFQRVDYLKKITNFTIS